MRKRNKHEPNDIYFYLSIQISKCMMRINSHIGPVRMQMTKTQKMNISDMNIQKIPNFCVCSLYDIESESINADETLLRVYSTDDR